MNSSPDSALEELTEALESLPVRTRRAMLAAVRCARTPLIVGAYAARGLGVCPLLAAHRRGGRENSRSTFAGAFDRFTGTPTGSPRAITDGEREALQDLLVASLERHAERRAAVVLGRGTGGGRRLGGARWRFADHAAHGVRPNPAPERIPAAVA